MVLCIIMFWCFVIHHLYHHPRVLAGCQVHQPSSSSWRRCHFRWFKDVFRKRQQMFLTAEIFSRHDMQVCIKWYIYSVEPCRHCIRDSHCCCWHSPHWSTKLMRPASLRSRGVSRCAAEASLNLRKLVTGRTGQALNGETRRPCGPWGLRCFWKSLNNVPGCAVCVLIRLCYLLCLLVVIY